MTDKRCSLAEAAGLVRDGEMVAVGGSLLQRTPAALVRELARQGRRDLELAKPSPGYDADLLAAAGCLARIRSGIVSFEQPFGMAPNFRRAVEQGEVEVVEHA
jgi:glutaconate CoA-transferase subunit A